MIDGIQKPHNPAQEYFRSLTRKGYPKYMVYQHKNDNGSVTEQVYINDLLLMQTTIEPPGEDVQKINV